MSEGTAKTGWSALLRPAWLPAVAVLVGGVLLHSMNVLMLATVLPSVVDNLGGAALMSWTSSAFLASSIVAATCTGYLTAILGGRTVFCAGAVIFGLGALTCALAPSMAQVVAGRFVQGFGGGLLTAMAYVLVRSTFPETLWARGFTLLSGAWSLSILVGPLVGGVFARYGDWRGAFFLVTAIAGVLALVALRALPRVATTGAGARVPGLRVLLICVAIAVMSAMAVAPGALAKAGLFAGAIGTLVLAMAVDRRAPRPLLPTDAFSLRSPTGVGLWLILLVAIAYSPLQIFVPIFSGLMGRRAECGGRWPAPPSAGRDALIVAGTPPQRTGRPGRRRSLMAWAAGVALLMPIEPAPLVLRRRPGGRRHRRVLGVHRPEGHERRAGRRGGSRRLVGRHGATDRSRFGAARRPGANAAGLPPASTGRTSPARRSGCR
jgi:MFS family permease